MTYLDTIHNLSAGPEDGQKRWVKDIPTFQAEGYRWGDVAQNVSCSELRLVPDGETIPPGSGQPRQP